MRGHDAFIFFVCLFCGTAAVMLALAAIMTE